MLNYNAKNPNLTYTDGNDQEPPASSGPVAKPAAPAEAQATPSFEMHPDFEALIDHFATFICGLDDRIEEAQTTVTKLRQERDYYKQRLSGLITVPKAGGQGQGQGRRLSDEKIAAIKSATGSLAHIAENFGVSMMTAQKYRNS